MLHYLAITKRPTKAASPSSSCSAMRIQLCINHANGHFGIPNQDWCRIYISVLHRNRTVQHQTTYATSGNLHKLRIIKILTTL
jgi:hypothetical protein